VVRFGQDDPPARARHPNHLTHRRGRVGHVLEDALGAYPVERRVRKRQGAGVAGPELQPTPLADPVLRLGNQFLAGIDSDNVPLLADPVGERNRVGTCWRSDRSSWHDQPNTLRPYRSRQPPHG
jgi:hypothetical protein